MKRLLLFAITMLISVSLSAPVFAAGPPFTPPGPPRPVPAPLPDEACTQVPELCHHQ
jgi:hypothetical protein